MDSFHMTKDYKAIASHIKANRWGELGYRQIISPLRVNTQMNNFLPSIRVR
jgi:hypothetical protein